MACGMTDQRPALLKALSGETLARPPVWFMRQAGRYLPEYRALRATAPDFVSFCLDPDKAAEATLQPMRRFPFDCSIVFADILLIPTALGQEVRFEAGEGPRLGPLPDLERARELAPRAAEGVLTRVGETLAKVRAGLEPDRALIGFAGAPWTVLTYMLDGDGSHERPAARRWAYEQPELVDGWLEVLVEATARYLAMQEKAGAQVLKIFESWAEGIPEPLFERLVIGPHRALATRLRELGVQAPLIGFPRGAGVQVEAYAAAVPVQGVALDTAQTLALGQRVQAGGKTVQGALDPLLLRSLSPDLEVRVDQFLDAWGRGPYVFNLGHGILPDTPIEAVERVLNRIHAWRG